MTELRERMLEDLKLHGLAKNTQNLYVQAVRQLAKYCRKPPDQITEEELRQYFLYLTQVKKIAPSTLTVAVCRIRFFYEHTLHRQWTILNLIRSPKEKKLPEVLTIEEVRRILGCVHHLCFKACLSTIYACGLWASIFDRNITNYRSPLMGNPAVLDSKEPVDLWSPIGDHCITLL